MDLSHRSGLSTLLKNMTKAKFMAVIAIPLMLVTITAAQRASSPVAAAKTFYHFERARSDAFTRRGVAARKPYLSPELYSLFQKELRREDEYLKKNPTDKPYFGDGFPFQPYDEACKVGRRSLHKTLKIDPAFEKGDRAAVTATFAFPAPCKDPDATTYTIGLVKVRGRWLIDDVNFGEDRSLKQDLNRKDY